MTGFVFFCDFFCQTERNTICLSMIIIYIYICFPEENLSDSELETRTKAQGSFLRWPSDAKGKKKHPTSPALKLNLSALKPFVGRSELEGRLGTIPFLEPFFEHVSKTWGVS